MLKSSTSPTPPTVLWTFTDYAYDERDDTSFHLSFFLWPTADQAKHEAEKEIYQQRKDELLIFDGDVVWTEYETEFGPAYKWGDEDDFECAVFYVYPMVLQNGS